MADSAPEPSDLARVRAAYDSWSAAYVDRYGTVDQASAEDRAAVGRWADGLEGPVLDAGCGPGHWTAFLHRRGPAVEGVDASPAFIEHARSSHPGPSFRVGDLRRLDLGAGSLGGVLAWFSLIHLDPGEIPQVLRRFAEALRPGGALLVGFFAGDELRPFDHRVVSAWTWPTEWIERLLVDAGLEPGWGGVHPQPSGRVFAERCARRPARAARAPSSLR